MTEIKREQAQAAAASLIGSAAWQTIADYMDQDSRQLVGLFAAMELHTPDAMQRVAFFQGQVKARLDFILDVETLADEHKQKQEDIE